MQTYNVEFFKIYILLKSSIIDNQLNCFDLILGVVLFLGSTILILGIVSHMFFIKATI